MTRAQEKRSTALIRAFLRLNGVRVTRGQHIPATLTLETMAHTYQSAVTHEVLRKVYATKVQIGLEFVLLLGKRRR